MNAGRFLTDLDARHVGKQRKQLLADLVYEAADGTRYVVETGFESDGASVPRILWALYPPFGEVYEPATWLHDKLYRDAEEFPGMTRELADALLEEASLACGFRVSGRNVMHFGVRAGGRRTWNRHRAEAEAREAEAMFV